MTSPTQAPTITDSAARAIFDNAYAAAQDPEQRAKLELMREYFCNPQFRRDLADHLWESRA